MFERNSPVFESALKHTLKTEAGYVKDPLDRGGETFRGISRRSWPSWYGWKLIDQIKADGLRSASLIDQRFADDQQMAELVADLYFCNFWKPFACLSETERLQIKIFDTGVNAGVGRAIKLLQQSINLVNPQARLKVDGALGPKTRAALDGLSESYILSTYSSEQAAFYRGIVDRNPSQQRFIKGWLRRAAWIPL